MDMLPPSTQRLANRERKSTLSKIFRYPVLMRFNSHSSRAESQGFSSNLEGEIDPLPEQPPFLLERTLSINSSERGYGKLRSLAHLHFSSPIVITRLIMMVLLFLSTMVLSISLWYATGQAYDSAVSSMNLRLRSNFIVGTKEYFNFFLQGNRNAASTYGAVMENLLAAIPDLLSSSSYSQLFLPVMWSFMKESSHLSSIAYAELATPKVYSYLNISMPNLTFLILTSGSSPTNVTWYAQPVNPLTGEPTSIPTVIPPVTPYTGTQIDDYVVRGRSIAWSLFPTSSGPYLACLKSVMGANKSTTAGFSIVTTDTITLSNYLRGLNFSGVTIFVQSGEGYLVACSNNVLNYDNSTGRVKLINSTDALDPVVAEASKYLQEKYSLQDLFQSSIILDNLDIAGQISYVHTFPATADNYQLLIVVVFPRDSVMGEIDRQRSHVLLIVCLASAGVLLVGWGIIIFVTVYVSIRMRPKEELLWQQAETARAQSASEVKSQFLANISHDLRTPMAGILGLLDIMLCDRLTGEQEANLRQMKSCASSLLGLLNNILDLAKVEAGKMQLEMLEFDIVGELESLVDMFSVQGLSNGTEVALDLSDSMERTVKGDPSRFRQVFANLLSNACKFTKEGHVLVRGGMAATPTTPTHASTRSPALSPLDGPKRKVRFVFEVDDTGPGIPLEKRDLIFEKFQQADLSTTRTHGGTGLGLGIVRSLVKLMGGSISVVDKEGPGACFRFDLSFECLGLSSKWRNSVVQPEFLLPKLSTMEGGQVLLAMKETSAGAQIAQAWMERRGLQVWRVSQWDDIATTVSTMLQKGSLAAAPCSRPPPNFSPRDGKGQVQIDVDSAESSHGRAEGALEGDSADLSRLNLAIIDSSLIPNPFQFLAEELNIFRARLQSQGVVIAWLVEHNTSSETRRALRRSGCAVASKPLYASRLAPLLALATARKGMTQTSSQLFPIGDSGTLAADGAGGSGMLRREGSMKRSMAGSGPVRNSGATIFSSQWEQSPKQDVPVMVIRPRVKQQSQGAIEKEPLKEGNGQSSTAKQPAVQNDVTMSPPVPEFLKQIILAANTKPSEEDQKSTVPRPLTPLGGSVDLQKPPMSAPLAPVDTARDIFLDERESSKQSAVVGSLRLSGRTRSLSVPKHSSGPQPNVDGSLKGLHVLIAEDTPLLQKVAVIRMQKLGCTVVAVNNGKEAVEAVLKTYAKDKSSEGPPFDAILMDCQMPILNGYGATAAIREAEKGTDRHIPIIAVTAHAMTSDERKCLDAGMDAYLTKPIDPVLMASTVKRLVKGGNADHSDLVPPSQPSLTLSESSIQRSTTGPAESNSEQSLDTFQIK